MIETFASVQKSDVLRNICNLIDGKWRRDYCKLQNAKIYITAEEIATSPLGILWWPNFPRGGNVLKKSEHGFKSRIILVLGIPALRLLVVWLWAKQLTFLRLSFLICNIG